MGVLFENDKPSGIDLVYSSLDIFESVTADVLGTDGFNSDYFNPSFDERSDAKGPEPESIVVGQCKNGNAFVFVGMERANGIFVFDITNLDDGNVEYLQYFNNQDYSIEFEEDTRPPESAGDIGPEQLRFIDESVYGEALLFVAYPESSSVSIYSIDCGADDDDDDDESASESGDSSEESSDAESESKSESVEEEDDEEETEDDDEEVAYYYYSSGGGSGSSSINGAVDDEFVDGANMYASAATGAHYNILIGVIGATLSAFIIA